VTVFAQTPPPQPTKAAAPPPADLEPGVNTSAIQPSSEAAPTTPAPAPATPARVAKPAARNSAATNTANSANTPNSAQPATAVPTARTATPKTGAAGAGKAPDRIELDATQITGNRELPKVLYIVPWKRSDLGDLLGKPVNSLVDEVLAPVDRDVFKRQNRYYDALKPDAAKHAACAASGPQKPWT